MARISRHRLCCDKWSKSLLQMIQWQIAVDHLLGLREGLQREAPSQLVFKFKVALSGGFEAHSRVLQEEPPPIYQTAVHGCLGCGKRYSTSHHLSQHQGKCRITKRRIEELLDETRAHWAKRKRAKTTATLRGPEDGGSASNNVRHESPVKEAARSSSKNILAIDTESLEVGTTSCNRSDDIVDLDVPVAQRKFSRVSRLPKRYRQDSPEEPSPPARQGEAPSSSGVSSLPEVRPSDISLVNLVTTNAFGISKAYSLPPSISIECVRKCPGNTGYGSRLTQIAPSGASSGVVQTERTDNLSHLPHKLTNADPKNRPSALESPCYGPFNNNSAFSLAEWYWASTNKSFRDFKNLVAVLKDPGFSVDDIADVNWKAAFKMLGSSPEDPLFETCDWMCEDGWRCTPVSIDVPFHRQMNRPGIEKYSAGKFYHRPLVSVIKERLTNRAGTPFHYYPYWASWEGQTGVTESELYGELYTSRAFRQAYEALQQEIFDDANKGLERIVVALMFSSDTTHLTSFGSANLWPCYLFFGNESKYERCKPSKHRGEQVAYFLKLPNDFNDYLKKRNEGRLPPPSFMRYCSKKLFHQQWSIMLDEELINAMKDGIVVMCPDGKKRHFFPRFFTYSADYPERILIGGIRNNGTCPCHRCLIDESDLGNLGSPVDIERHSKKRSEASQTLLVDKAVKHIEGGRAVAGKKVEKLLKSQSLVPVRNAITTALSPLKFNLIPSLVPDPLHEFDIGVWKNLYIHLIRMLKAGRPKGQDGEESHTKLASTGRCEELDFRYRATPIFGRDTIRRFGVNASEMKRKAARDYEDLLQCSIPAFESLFPGDDNSILMTLLCICAQWQALAKLRLHNDSTLKLLDYTTVRLGAQMRLFDRDVCSHYLTKELPKEAEARVRRDAKKGRASSGASKSVSLGVFTIKFHLLGDYCDTIRMYGTTDSYSTELVRNTPFLKNPYPNTTPPQGETFHRTPKSWYPRTDKKEYEGQFAQIERRSAHLSKIRTRLGDRNVPKKQRATKSVKKGRTQSAKQTSRVSARKQSTMGHFSVDNPPPQEFEDSEYVIASNENCPIHITSFNETVDAGYERSYCSGFIRKLHHHLLPRLLLLLGHTTDDAKKCDWSKVSLQGDCVYSHKTMQILFTTYDLCRDDDIIHVGNSKCNIMLLNGAQMIDPAQREPPYLYAKVLGVFHANVAYFGILPGGKVDHTYYRLDFVWVRWYDSLTHGEEFKLDRLSLHPLTSEGALGFIDPSYIIRGVHIIPRFCLGEALNLAPPSILVQEGQLWKEYYINRFADRDLFMRYQYQCSVGHRYMYAPDFPYHASIPSIHPDFDHCFQVKEVTLPQSPGGAPSGLSYPATHTSHSSLNNSPQRIADSTSTEPTNENSLQHEEYGVEAEKAMESDEEEDEEGDPEGGVDEYEGDGEHDEDDSDDSGSQSEEEEQSDDQDETDEEAGDVVEEDD
ncbi:hypothetical protein NMY22_g6430 [Coprinellus aureogranulatus]|nr:hypothetical protein NMY22_g6430 [Coprinellus aureogranulatus]